MAERTIERVNRGASMEVRAAGPYHGSLSIESKRTKDAQNRASASPSAARASLFEELMLPHLDAAYNLARWLMRSEQDAQDAVQEAYLRAFGYFETFRGGDARAWLMAVVRNTCHTWQRRLSKETNSVPFDELSHGVDESGPRPDQDASDRQGMGVLRRCIEELPEEFREVLVMREFEEMSYREMAEATGLAIGTVMSRLSRARKRLEECAASRTQGASR